MAEETLTVSATDAAGRDERRPHLIFDFGGVLFRWRPAELLARVQALLRRTSGAAGSVCTA